MTKKVSATVCYPVYVNLEVPDDLPIYEIQMRVIELADKLFDSSSVSAVIHDSNIPEIIE